MFPLCPCSRPLSGSLLFQLRICPWTKKVATNFVLVPFRGLYYFNPVSEIVFTERADLTVCGANWYDKLYEYALLCQAACTAIFFRMRRKIIQTESGTHQIDNVFSDKLYISGYAVILSALYPKNACAVCKSYHPLQKLAVPSQFPSPDRADN